MILKYNKQIICVNSWVRQSAFYYVLPITSMLLKLTSHG